MLIVAGMASAQQVSLPRLSLTDIQRLQLLTFLFDKSWQSSSGRLCSDQGGSYRVYAPDFVRQTFKGKRQKEQLVSYEFIAPNTFRVTQREEIEPEMVGPGRFVDHSKVYQRLSDDELLLIETSRDLLDEDALSRGKVVYLGTVSEEHSLVLHSCPRIQKLAAGNKT